MANIILYATSTVSKKLVIWYSYEDEEHMAFEEFCNRNDIPRPWMFDSDASTGMFEMGGEAYNVTFAYMDESGQIYATE